MFHLTTHDPGGGFRHLHFRVSHSRALFLGKQQYRADGLAVSNDGRHYLGRIAVDVFFVGHSHDFSPACPIDGHRLPVGNRRFQIGADGLIRQFFFAYAAGRYYLIPIHDARNMTHGAKNGFRIILGERRHFPDGRIFFQNDLAVPVDPATAQVFSGLGSTANFRNGPGKDAEGTPVYSFNIAMANALFDREGKILNVFVDVYEVSTPNYDGETMPHFSGWPGREGYNVTDPATGKVTGVSQNTEESAAEELSQWKTKRDRGDGYGMNPSNEWYKQMNAYQQWMTGKTVAELRDWYGSSTRPSTGRPLDPASNAEEDQERLSALSQQEKDDLADLRSMATMSLSDSHGLLLEAIEKAYENRVPVGGVAVE